MLKIKEGDIVKYDDNIEKIKEITFKVNADFIEYYCAELEIDFESGRFYYDEITSFEHDIEWIKERLYDNANDLVEKVGEIDVED